MGKAQKERLDKIYFFEGEGSVFQELGGEKIGDSGDRNDVYLSIVLLVLLALYVLFSGQLLQPIPDSVDGIIREELVSETAKHFIDFPDKVVERYARKLAPLTTNVRLGSQSLRRLGLPMGTMAGFEFPLTLFQS